MKKIAMAIAVLTMAFSVGAVSVLAAGPARTAPGRSTGFSGFADADGNGICDNRTDGQGDRFIDADGDGVCDNARSGQGRKYTDTDGEGICDFSRSSRNTWRGGCRNMR